MNEARAYVREAIRRRGSVQAAADATGVHFTRMYAFLAGGQLLPENLGRLRAYLPDVPAEVWLAVVAPMPADSSDAA